jgi:hypothetical protein
VRFGGEDVVRHKLVQHIVEAYDAHSQREALEHTTGLAVGGRAAEGAGRSAIRSA